MTLAQRLVSGVSPLLLSQGLVRLLAIVTMPILTVLLSPHDYGVASLVGTVVLLASVLALAGIETSYARSCGGATPSANAATERFCWRFAVVSSLIAAGLAAGCWWALSGISAGIDRGLTLVVAAGIVLSVLHAMAQTRARMAGRYRAIAAALVVTGSVAALASVAIAMLWRQDALALLLPLLLGFLIPIVMLGAPPLAGLARPSGLSGEQIARLVRIGIASVATAPMYWLMSSSDRWYLQHYQGAEAVGVYSVGHGVAVIGTMVNAAIMAVWLPEALREYENFRERAGATLGRLMSRLAAAMAFVWLTVAAAGGDTIRWLADERFHAAADYVPYVAGGVFFHGVMSLASSGLLLARRLHAAIAWWCAGGALCMVLNFVLVPRWGALGAAATQCISFALVAAGVLATSQAVFRAPLAWPRLALVMPIVVAAGVWMTPAWHESPPLSLVLKIAPAAALCALVAWLMAPDWCRAGIERLRRRGDR